MKKPIFISGLHHAGNTHQIWISQFFYTTEKEALEAVKQLPVTESFSVPFVKKINAFPK